MGKLLRVDEVAFLTGWKESTVRAKILKREMPFVKLGKSVRIKESTIIQLIEDSTIPARTENGGRR